MLFECGFISEYIEKQSNKNIGNSDNKNIQSVGNSDNKNIQSDKNIGNSIDVDK